MTLTHRAYQYAKFQHRKQYRNDMATPFIVHPKQVALLLQVVAPNDDNLIAAGYLHDVIENCGVTYKDLIETFNEDIADLVIEVTKTGYNKFPRLKTRRGVVLKFADRLSNLSEMDRMDQRFQEKYLRKSRFWKV